MSRDPQTETQLSAGEVIDLMGRELRVMAMPDGTTLCRDHRKRIAVRNVMTNRLSYVPEQRLLQAKSETDKSGRDQGPGSHCSDCADPHCQGDEADSMTVDRIRLATLDEAIAKVVASAHLTKDQAQKTVDEATALLQQLRHSSSAGSASLPERCLGELREGGEVVCQCKHGKDGQCGFSAD